MLFPYNMQIIVSDSGQESAREYRVLPLHHLRFSFEGVGEWFIC